MTTHIARRRMLTQAVAADISRRSALRGLGGALAAAVVLATHSRRTAAQVTTPAAVPPLFQEWADAWGAGDLERLMDLYTEDAVLEDVTAGVVFQGKEEIRTHNEDELGAFNPAYELLSAFVAGDRAAAEFRWTATYVGTYPPLPPGTGQVISLRGAVFLELADERIVREAHYYDAYSFLIQLGVLPAPGTEATPAGG